MELRKDLMEQYEDAVFALAMDAIAAEEGAALLRENERLKADPDFLIPEPADRRSRKTIVRSFRRRRRKRTLRATGRTFQRISVVAFIGILLFSGVYAALPETRHTSVKSSDSLFAVVDTQIRRIIRTRDVDGLLPYEFDVLPEGFTLAAAGSDGATYWKYYTGSDDKRIQLTVTDISYGLSDSSPTATNVKYNEAIQVNGNEGVLLGTDDWLRAQLIDQKYEIMLDIKFYGLSRDDVLYVLTGLTYTGVDFYGTPFNFTYD